MSAIRITPEMINFFKKKLAGVSDDSPDSPPKIAPTIRKSTVPVADRLPPVQQQGFSTPDAGYQNVIRPNNLASPPSIAATNAQMPTPDQIQTPPIIDKSLFDTRAVTSPVMPAPSINTNQVIGRNPFADTQPSLAAAQPGIAPAIDESLKISRNPQFNIQLAPQPNETARTPASDISMSALGQRMLRQYGLDGGLKLQPAPAVLPAASANPTSTARATTATPSAAEARRAQLEDRFAKLLQLEGTKAVDHNGRLKSGFLGALRGFLTGGIGGAIYGGIRGGTHPQWDEELKQASEVLKERGKLDEAMQLEKELSGLDDAQSQRALREAQTQKILNPSPAKPIYRTDAQGRVVKITQGANGEPDRTEVVVNTKKAAGAPRTQWVDGHLMVFDENRNLVPVTTKDGKEVTDQLRTPVDFEIEGKTYKVSPNTAAMAQATGERFNISQSATESRFERGEQRSDARAAASDDRAAARQEEADRKSATVQLNLARQKREQAAKAKTQEEADQLLGDADEIEATTATNYPGVVEQVQPNVFDAATNPTGMKPRYRVKARGAAPTVQQSSGPSSGPAKGRVSRAKFVEKNPQFKSKSQAEIDRAIQGAGFTPY